MSINQQGLYNPAYPASQTTPPAAYTPEQPGVPPTQPGYPGQQNNGGYAANNSYQAPTPAQQRPIWPWLVGGGVLVLFMLCSCAAIAGFVIAISSSGSSSGQSSSNSLTSPLVVTRPAPSASVRFVYKSNG